MQIGDLPHRQRVIFDEHSAVLLGVVIERKLGDDADRLHSWLRAQCVDRARDHARDVDARRIGHVGQCKAEGDGMARVEARIDIAQPREAAREQTRRGEQHQRESQLGDDQRAARSMTATPPGRARSLGDEHRRRRCATAPRCRQPARDECRDRGCSEGEQQSRRVETDLAQSRNGGRESERLENAHRLRREKQADSPTDDRDNDRLGAEIGEERAARRTECAAHRGLVLPTLGPREEEIRDVREDERQKRRDSAGNDPERSGRIADDDVAQWSRVRVHVDHRDPGGGEAPGKGFGHTREQTLQLGRRDFGGDAGAKTREPAIVERRGLRARGIEAQRRPHRGAQTGEIEARRHHADDRAFDAVDSDTTPDDRVVAGEHALPEAVADRDDWRRAGLAVRLDQTASAKRSVSST